MKASTMLRPARMKRRMKRVRRGARHLPFRRQAQPTGLAKLTTNLTSLLARVTGAWRRLVGRPAGRKVTAPDGGGRAAPRTSAAEAEPAMIRSSRERVTSLARRRLAPGHHIAGSPSAAPRARAAERAPRPPRALVADAVDRFAARGR